MQSCKRCYLIVLMLIIVSCSAMVGCAASSGVPVFPASGKLTVNGEPAKGAIVGLHPVNGDFDQQGTRPAGKVLDDGTFVISTYKIGDGAPAGEYRASIVWPQFPDRDDPGADRMKGKYADPKTSPVAVTIQIGRNSLEPIVLENLSMLPSK